MELQADAVIQALVGLRLYMRVESLKRVGAERLVVVLSRLHVDQAL